MKTILLAVFLAFSPVLFYGQTLTGLWIGQVHNDSTTIRKDQSFEIVLTQYKDKVYGFSRSTFVVNDSLFYIVKRVKGTIEGDVCEVKDDEVVSYNFRGRLDKGVKMVSTFRFDHNDSAWRMDGDWKTNKTKKYYSLSGKIALAQEKDLEKSKIFPHLEELKLADDVAFYKESKKEPEMIAAVKQPVIQKPITVAADKKKTEPVKESKSDAIVKNNSTDVRANKTANSNPVAAVSTEPEKKIAQAQIINKDQSPTQPVIKETKTEPIEQVTTQRNTPTRPAIVEEKKVAATNTKKDSAIVQVKTNPVSQPTQQPIDATKNVAAKEVRQAPKQSEPVVVTKPIEEKKDNTVKETKTMSAPTLETEKQKPVSLFADAKPANVISAAEFVGQRKVAAPQIVNYRSDSLELVLYDNGEVDGDTVSVLLNGELIMAKQGLKASAIKKTIYLPTGKDQETTLVLYAENLGKYPPNTGLLIVHDGDDTYQIRFSADLQQNAAVIFKRKKE